MWKPVTSSILMCRLLASPEDKADIQKEVEEYTAQLAENPSDYSNFIRSTGSTQQYVDLFYTEQWRCLLTLLPVWIL